MVEICLYEPEIAQNTGAIARLCACFGVVLNIIEPMSFIMSNDKKFKRAGMDYIPKITIKRHESFDVFKKKYAGNIILFDVKARDIYYDIEYLDGDCLLFGKESTGVPDNVYNACSNKVRIPMLPGMRSLNLAMCTAIGLSEAVRQLSKNCTS
ncbi:MAG: tRNA (cytidine(34)-2'-O)-methyltransferase [Holosporales bacterium]|jgi:tRNA (cytidine/uridine-2'-O-)-methyltransferase|nr:tRNA (cytidine(34)-2'-O)-methyltransferase [Holosporales bacterium]